MDDTMLLKMILRLINDKNDGWKIIMESIEMILLENFKIMIDKIRYLGYNESMKIVIMQLF